MSRNVSGKDIDFTNNLQSEGNSPFFTGGNLSELTARQKYSFDPYAFLSHADYLGGWLDRIQNVMPLATRNGKEVPEISKSANIPFVLINLFDIDRMLEHRYWSVSASRSTAHTLTNLFDNVRLMLNELIQNDNRVGVSFIFGNEYIETKDWEELSAKSTNTTPMFLNFLRMKPSSPIIAQFISAVIAASPKPAKLSNIGKTTPISSLVYVVEDLKSVRDTIEHFAAKEWHTSRLISEKMSDWKEMIIDHEYGKDIVTSRLMNRIDRTNYQPSAKANMDVFVEFEKHLEQFANGTLKS